VRTSGTRTSDACVFVLVTVSGDVVILEEAVCAAQTTTAPTPLLTRACVCLLSQAYCDPGARLAAARFCLATRFRSRNLSCFSLSAGGSLLNGVVCSDALRLSFPHTLCRLETEACKSSPYLTAACSPVPLVGLVSEVIVPLLRYASRALSLQCILEPIKPSRHVIVPLLLCYRSMQSSCLLFE
jgi:hypothetical protein